MELSHLTRGDKRDIHLSLYDREIAVLDNLRARYGCSRAAIVGAMLVEMHDVDLRARIPTDRVRRAGAGRPPIKD